MSYEYLEELSTADVAFVARGKTLEELFRSAGDALTNSMVEDLESIDTVRRVEVRLDAAEPDRLLFSFLQEFIYYKDAELLLLRTEEVQISETNGRYSLDARLAGEEIDPEKHDMLVDVKAVTFHQYYVKRTPEGWEAQAILDV